jgi:predicted pyridoxine 5'-phosphate oxidase superfamily flavin-nucleotide-binding protein
MCAEEIFHDGELEIQRRAGVAAVAARVGEANVIDSVPPGFADFLSERFFVVVGSADPDGHVWASLLIGPPGFIRTVDSRHLAVMAEPVSGDPLQRSVDAGPVAVGLLALDAATRSRIRVNGVASRRPDGGLVIEVSEVFGNCPKYIQRRTPASLIGEGDVGHTRIRSTALDGPQSSLVSAADTFFIASLHPDRGADASHRGGRPGFVRVQPDGRSLTFPDYTGNSMFQTLGNLQVDGRAGLLFIDWERGDTLQLSGRARIVWDADTIAAWPGAQRVVEFAIEAVQQHQRALPLRWELLERHRLNPPVPGDVAEVAVT